jgi:hypothetical protein
MAADARPSVADKGPAAETWDFAAAPDVRDVLVDLLAEALVAAVDRPDAAATGGSPRGRARGGGESRDGAGLAAVPTTETDPAARPGSDGGGVPEPSPSAAPQPTRAEGGRAPGVAGGGAPDGVPDAVRDALEGAIGDRSGGHSGAVGGTSKADSAPIGGRS